MAEGYGRQSASESASIPHWYTPDKEIPTIVDGEGSHVYDDAGNEYLDFSSQLYCVNAGHDNQAIIEAMSEQLGRVPYVSSSSHNDARTELAGRIADVAPEGLSDVFFSVSGSEANEAAVQIARRYSEGHKVLSRWRSYHGSTYGAGSLTAEPTTRNSLEEHAATTGAGKFLPPLDYQGPFPAETDEELAEQAADHLEWVIRNEGADSVAAVITEPIAGASGAYTAPPGYFQRVREICDEYDVLLISDEVIAGFGRCGDWFGVQTEDVVPDIITFAKGVTSAYAPLAGAIVNEDIAEHIRTEGFDVGQTFGGHPVACAGGVAAIDEYADGLIQNVRDLEPVFAERLAELEADHEVVGDTRGRGFLWSVEFTDPETGEPFHLEYVDDEDEDNPVLDVYDEAKERGVVFFPGRPMVQLMLSPPLCTTEAEIHEAFDVLDESIEAVFG